MSGQDEYERTIFFGESALDHLKVNAVPAFPRNYELWYTYSAGFNHVLNRAVNAILRERGKISNEEVQSLYDQHLSPHRLGVRIEEVGGRVADEINELEQLVESAVRATSSYGVSLEEAHADLGATQDADQLQTIVSRLIASTRTVEAQNRRLEAQLTESKKELDSLQSSLEAIRYESLTDQLTTLANRKHFDQSLERALYEARDTGQPLSLLLGDIDHFKRFNDTFGHQTGDQVLRLVALSLKQNVKGQDIACRYGGEEFAVILPRTSLNSARVVGEHIRQAVAAKELIKRSTGENLGRVTISIGISSYHPDDSDLSLIDRADSCLYSAKNSGRNRVVIETDPVVRRDVA